MSKLTEALNILANTDCASFKRSEPTAEEALEWLAGRDYEAASVDFVGHVVNLYDAPDNRQYQGSTPLEAIRNAMKGESDD